MEVTKVLDKVVLRLTELLKEKNIIDKNEKDTDKIVIYYLKEQVFL